MGSGVSSLTEEEIDQLEKQGHLDLSTLCSQFIMEPMELATNRINSLYSADAKKSGPDAHSSSISSSSSEAKEDEKDFKGDDEANRRDSRLDVRTPENIHEK